MNHLLQDAKTAITVSLIAGWDICTNMIVSAIFILFDLVDLKLSKEYAEIIVWYLGTCSLLVYSIYRVIEMIHKSHKTRLEKELLELQKEKIEKSN
jgi:hypothetical protein